MEISQYRLAKEIGVPAQRIGDIVAGKGQLVPTPTCAYAGFLAFLTATGCALKRPMTRKLRNAR